MSKIRVYELAKELGMESKDVLRRLGKMGEDVKNHMSTVSTEHAEMLRAIMRPKMADIAEEKQKDPSVSHEEKPKPHHTEDAPQEEKTEAQDTSAQKTEKEPPISHKAEEKPVAENAKETPPEAPAEIVKPEKKPEKPQISTEVPVTDQPRQQGVFAKKPNRDRQQGVFQKGNRPQDHRNRNQQGEQGGHPRQQGNFQNRNQNNGGQGGYQNRNNNGGQGGYQNRNNNGGQGGYQNRNNNGGQGGYQNRNNNGGQGGFQNRNNNGGQGGFQNRNNNGGQGGFQNRNNNGGQGGFQNRNNNGGQGGFQNRNNNGGQGGFQNRNNNGGQGGFQNRNNNGGQGGFQNRNNNGGQGGFQNRNNNGGQGGFQNRNNNGGQGGFQNRSNDGGQGGTQNREQRDTGFTTENRPQEKRDPRRFEQKKKNNHFDSRKKEMDRRENMRHRPNPKQKRQKKEEMPPVVPKTVVIGETVVISELAKSMSKTAAELIKVLFGLGVMATVNQEIDADTAIILGDEFGITVEIKQDKTLEIMDDDVDEESTLEARPPVVTVMGHVDHGKTSLLDAIRNTNVSSREAGGITQHIGAYQVEINGKKITFLDTPGHEAFTAMRARGAQVTDIAVLVVAADDGVMPQTIEAINHAKAAGVPIIVAINKIDKPGASVDKIRQELTEYELVDEEWGGNTIMVPVSAKKEEGIENLLEMILLVAEVAELKSNPHRNARGTVVEAQLDKGRGAVATLLIQKGTLNVGDIIVAGAEFAKVRAMIDDKGRRCKTAGPSAPVEILGFSSVPPAGEIFVGVDDEKDARYIADHNSQIKREKELGKSSKVSLDDLFKQISEGEVKDLNIVLKADVQGSVEALAQSIANLTTDEVRVNIIHSGVGAIVETDVMLAEASDAIIIGFNVRPDVNTKKAAEKAGVEILMYRVIYEALDAIKAAMSGLLDPEFKEVVVGHVEVRDVIKVPKVGLIAGSYVLDGKVVRNGQVRLLRNGIVIHEGVISSLKRFKDDAKEVQTGFECGIGIENFNDIKIEDQMEIFIMEETKRELE